MTTRRSARSSSHRFKRGSRSTLMRYTRRTTSLLALAVLGACCCVPFPATAALITGSQAISGSWTSPQYTVNDPTSVFNGQTIPSSTFGYSYTSIFDGAQLTNDVQILYFFDDRLHYTPADEEAAKAILAFIIE